jgi:hypothetical protein
MIVVGLSDESNFCVPVYFFKVGTPADAHHQPVGHSVVEAEFGIGTVEPEKLARAALDRTKAVRNSKVKDSGTKVLYAMAVCDTGRFEGRGGIGMPRGIYAIDIAQGVRGLGKGYERSEKSEKK